MNCAWFELFCRLPFSRLRLGLSRWHVSRCPRCQQACESREALPPLLVTADRLPPGLDLCPAVRQRIMGPGRPAMDASVSPPARAPWRWAYAAALLVPALLAGFWAFFHGRGMAPHPGPAAPRPSARTLLCSAKIAERPARVIQFQSQNPDRSIFWIARNDPRS